MTVCQQSILLVADKFGDVWSIDLTIDEAPELRLGHVSMVLDLHVDTNGSYIFTSDRDEQIRITNYPSTYDNHTYCLGHSR